MTPKTTCNSTPVRKGTPTASKVWKESLRKACLDRARKRRLLSATRTPSRNDHDLSDLVPARLLIEEEMMQQGVSLLSPCTDHAKPQAISPPEIPQYDPMETTTSVASSPHEEHFISEDELFDLLAEVEAEIERTESLELEGFLDLARTDELDLEERIAEFQEWEGNSVEGVLCPLCQEANLLHSHNRLVCPNHMDHSCAFDVQNTLNLSLDDLQERLRVGYDLHTSYCHENLSFQMISDITTDDVAPMGASLVAVCDTCGTRIPIA
jgi:hypothetical protein